VQMMLEAPWKPSSRKVLSTSEEKAAKSKELYLSLRTGGGNILPQTIQKKGGHSRTKRSRTEPFELMDRIINSKGICRIIGLNRSAKAHSLRERIVEKFGILVRKTAFFLASVYLFCDEKKSGY
jgi:hypothetical protein